MKTASKEILLSLKPEQIKQLTDNHIDYVKSTGELITLQEYIRRILAGQSNKL